MRVNRLLQIVSVGVCVTLLFPGIGMVGANIDDIVVSIDRTTLNWTALGMGAPSEEDDADQSQNPRTVFSFVPSYGKPHADAGAKILGRHAPLVGQPRSLAAADLPLGGGRADRGLGLQLSLELARTAAPVGQGRFSPAVAGSG